jgi:glyoxalase family protein
MDTQLGGFHHLTAITAKASENARFYTGTLGMRLVKKTVNQDDTSAYHLFYADGLASPGTDITFFNWPAAREKRGTRSAVRTGLRVAGEKALDYWRARLAAAGVSHGDITLRDGRATLDFDDPEGQRLALVDDVGKGEAHAWAGSPVPVEFQIRGLATITMSVPEIAPTEALLTQGLNMRRLRDYKGGQNNSRSVHVFEMGPGGPEAELHVMVETELPQASQGAGAVHHIAFRTPDRESLTEWTQRMKALRVPTSGEVERYYFRSLYFREPNGVLFEIATDGPGFTADEPLDKLGQRLSLPPFLEGRRTQIEAGLKPL